MEEFSIHKDKEMPSFLGVRNEGYINTDKLEDLYDALLKSGIRIGNVEGYAGRDVYGAGYNFAWGKGENGYKNILNMMLNSEDGKRSLEGTYYHNFSPNAQAYIGGKPREIWLGFNAKI